MDFLALANERYSMRKFDSRPVEPEVLHQILESARIAPTATNAQPVRILVLDSPELIAPMDEYKVTRYHFHAPVVLMVCYDKTVSWKRVRFDGKEMGEVDASIATTHMMLAATSLGLGTTWVAAFNPEAAREAYQVPENLEIVALLPLGYPAADVEPAPKHFERNPMENMVSYHRF